MRATKGYGLSLLMLVQGCSTSGPYACPGERGEGIMVSVVDSATGEYVCDAHVVATLGSQAYSRPADAWTDASLSDCCCPFYILGAPGGSGTYVITASAPGLHMIGMAPSVDVQVDSCGDPGDHNVTITMTP
jgi:hypothetical protein